MDKRIIAFIVFLLIGFLSAEGNVMAVKSGGIKKVLSNYYLEMYNTGENPSIDNIPDVAESDAVSIDDIILTRADPPGGEPPPPPPPGGGLR